MMRHWNGGWGVGYWLLMSFGMALVWALLIAAIVLVVRYAGSPTTSSHSHQPTGPDRSSARYRTARDILDERYARGEIGDEEYRNRRETLDSE